MSSVPRIERACQNCGTRFSIAPSSLKNHGGKFCSRKCKDDSLRIAKNVPEYFWARVSRGDGCWNWTAYLGNHGYGTISWQGKTICTHRLAYELTYGPIPDGLAVLHHCDNRACCRPEHLFLGTNADNVADMVSKGRNPRGESCRHSKLTEDQVRDIRATFARGGISQRELAEQYGVDQANISCIVRGKSWKHI